MYNKQRINIANKCSNKHKPLQHSAQINRVLSKYEILCINLNTLLLQNIDLNNSSITTVQSCYTAKKKEKNEKDPSLSQLLAVYSTSVSCNFTFQSNHTKKETQNALLQSHVCSHDYHKTFDSKFFYTLFFRMRTTEQCIKLPFQTLFYMVYIPVKSLDTTIYQFFTFQRNSKVLKTIK